MLLVFLGAAVAARERQDRRIVALDLAEPAREALVIMQRIHRATVSSTLMG